MSSAVTTLQVVAQSAELDATVLDDIRAQATVHGPETLSDRQALAALISNHHPANASQLAARLLWRFRHFPGVLAASHAALTATVSSSAATDIKLAGDMARRLLLSDLTQGPLLNRYSVLADYLKASMKGRSTEAFRVLWLDARLHLIADETMWEGTLAHAPVLEREVYRRALEIGASSCCIAHCHPSQDASPSRADIDKTRQLVDGLRLISVKVHDHLIVAGQVVTSMAAQGLL